MWSVQMVLVVIPAFDRMGDFDDEPEGEQRDRADNEASHVRCRAGGEAPARRGRGNC